MLLTFKDVTFSYNKDDKVLKNVSFTLDYGEKVALLGLNGSGKSTLMLHSNGLLTPGEGDVLVNGRSTKSDHIKEIRQTVGLVFQNPDDQLFLPSVRDDVAFGPRNMNLSEEEVERRVTEALKTTLTEGLAGKSSYELSGGQKKSVAIATVLSMTPELLVMDEPTSGLDHLAIENFVSIMQKLPQAFLISTHDIELARRLCHRTIVLQKGRIVFDGDINTICYPEVLYS